MDVSLGRIRRLPNSHFAYGGGASRNWLDHCPASQSRTSNCRSSNIGDSDGRWRCMDFCKRPRTLAISDYGLEALVTNSRLLSAGIIGSVVAAVCCFTPVLVVLLGAVGLSALTGVLDYVLLPALVIFLALTGYALWQRQKTL